MPALVTLDQVNGALKLDLVSGDPRESDILLKIDQATDIVLDYIKAAYSCWTPENAPPRVTAAVMLIIKSLYDDAATAKMLSGLACSDVSNPVVGLLYSLRDPTLA